ncbi:hypothetical protein H5410_064676 [Solanum commersonii]|uniref:Uncharacterized protein n=1 Tax=Solanum commersonii TaxID=4109 RepID=A0A9J5VYN7_SOLCO|nr:hypothetical protein H5410_064676 [Solanum commersonii]
MYFSPFPFTPWLQFLLPKLPSIISSELHRIFSGGALELENLKISALQRKSSNGGPSELRNLSGVSS